MSNEKLGGKLYPIFDRTYMAFGSIMNACQRIITPENKEKIASFAWDFAKNKTEELLDELYEKNNQNEPSTSQTELPE